MDATHFGFSTETALPEGDGPDVTPTYWGYSVLDGHPTGRAGIMAAMSSKFFGAILIMAAGGLWLMPGAMLGAEILTMKIAASVMFLVFGGYLLWAGDRGEGELQVDTIRGELRFGRRDRNGQFSAKGVLPFGEVVSVFLTRNKDRQQPTRLFLRLGDGDTALEIAAGDTGRMEALRARLAEDLNQSQHAVEPVDVRLARHGIVAT